MLTDEELEVHGGSAVVAEKAFAYVHITFELLHEDSLLLDTEIDRSFTLEEVVIFQRWTWI